MTVVVGYVPTQTGFLAVTEGVREVRSLGGRLIVVNVVGAGGYTTVTAAQEKNLDAVHERLAEEAVDHEVRQIEDSVDPAEELLRIAEHEQATLIIVGLHRRSPIGKALMGSTAQRVMLGAHCPVLGVRSEDD